MPPTSTRSSCRLRLRTVRVCITIVAQAASIGYRQVLDFFATPNPTVVSSHASCPDSPLPLSTLAHIVCLCLPCLSVAQSDFHELLSIFQGATRRYVRRQLSFFRTEDVYRFVSPHRTTEHITVSRQLC